MCGIVGCIGFDESIDIVLRGLERLEYRGYDSCGISYIKENEVKVIKTVKRIENLKDIVNYKSNMCIGHTRWATHGKVNIENSHPHVSKDGNLVLVHNGVIDNFLELKEKYLENIGLKSETDTEIALEVINLFLKETGDITKSIIRFMNVVKGSYAIVMCYKKHPGVIYTLNYKSPLVIGKGEGFFTISSDMGAVSDITKEFYSPISKSYSIITRNEVKSFSVKGVPRLVDFYPVEIEHTEFTKNGYDTYMLKEIEEQPAVLKNIMNLYKDYSFDQELINTFKEINRIYVIASGTSYFSGLICKSIIEAKLSIPVECHLGSEFGHGKQIIDNKSLFIFLSQSGETADSTLVLDKIKGKYKTLAITNAKGSQIDLKCDYSLLVNAGVEISVASTKAYTAQIATLACLVARVSDDDTLYNSFKKILTMQQQVIKRKQELKVLAKTVCKYKKIFYIGRQYDSNLIMEAALKLKEVSYINVNAIAAGELKHGTISLIDEECLVIAIITDPKISNNTRSNIQEIKARNGKALIFSTNQTMKAGDDFVFDFDEVHEYNALVSILPHQLLAYFCALKLGLDIDKPRNLAKSVTVE